MEPFRRNLFNFSSIICILLHACGTQGQEIGRLVSENNVPHFESLGDAISVSESPSLSESAALASLPPFPSSLDSPSIDRISHSGSNSDHCTWDLITTTMSDDQLLKKALEVFASRHGLEKMRELIAMTTGLVFRPDSDESLNSVLPPDMSGRPTSISQMVAVNNSGQSFEKGIHREEGIAIPPSHFAEMLRGAINSDLSGGDLSASGGLPRSGSDEVLNPVTPEPPAVVVYDRLSSNHPSTSPERFLIIPGRRQRPFGTKVRVMVRNKIREVKITSSPRMTVYDALKQAEKKVQYLFPELSGQRVIHMDRKTIESKDGIRECSIITRVGRVEEDEENSWLIRVSYSPGAQIVYEGRCIPSEREVHVRPATTIDLILTPIIAASSESSS